jgi:chromosome segregation ATPase
VSDRLLALHRPDQEPDREASPGSLRARLDDALREAERERERAENAQRGLDTARADLYACRAREAHRVGDREDLRHENDRLRAELATARTRLLLGDHSELSRARDTIRELEERLLAVERGAVRL